LEDNPLSITNEINVTTVKYNRNSMFLTPTTEEEVVDLIKGLDNKKTCFLYGPWRLVIIRHCYWAVPGGNKYSNLALQVEESQK
jgi:hypothetical protein